MTLDPDKQRHFAVDVVERLRASSFEAYWAGGCVRDRLLARRPGDYDVATNARPEQIREVFGARRTLAIGAAFGVITVLGPRGAGQIEVATFRQDATYSDGRHPDSVQFSTAEEDARRRDFTINGLFFDPLAERLLDFVGGVDDIERRLVRAIGDPRERFAEDKLRMLRAVRFAATFDFALDAATLTAIQEMASQVTVVSAERIAAEMETMLESANRAAAMRLLLESGLLEFVLPEAQALVAAHQWDGALAVMRALKEPSFALALAAALYAAGASQQSAKHIVRQVAERWRLSKRDGLRAAWLVEQLPRLREARRMPWTKLQRLLIADGSDELLTLYEALAATGAADPAEAAFCRERLSLPLSELNPPPLLTGDDLVAHGVPRGAAYKTLLEQVRDAQLDRAITTRAEALALVDRLRAQK
jgi:tRNA nucleotidyltransferase/poly(A) polymerase